jgi:hypothetical protein
MIAPPRWIAIGCLLMLASCGGGRERQWMKVNQNYTTAEFRRDHAACTINKKLDEPCMRDRGWVDVSPSQDEKVIDPDVQKRRTYGTPSPPPPTAPPRR